MGNNSIEDIIRKYPSYDDLAEDHGAFGEASRDYEGRIRTQRDYEIDILRDLQRTVNRCRQRSNVSKELNELDRHYSPRIVSRVKSLDSIYRKIAKGEIKWESLPLEDTIGYRLVCRFIDEALELRSFLDEELDRPPFSIISRYPRNDNKEWIEKEPYSGYRSYDFAFIYKRPELGIELEGELQVRTIPQHAWAEVSHDTFYKNDRLSSAAGEYKECLTQDMHALSDMLSAVDMQFVQLRKLALMKKDKVIS